MGKQSELAAARLLTSALADELDTLDRAALAKLTDALLKNWPKRRGLNKR